jgi:hypothetical protein
VSRSESSRSSEYSKGAREQKAESNQHPEPSTQQLPPLPYYTRLKQPPPWLSTAPPQISFPVLILSTFCAASFLPSLHRRNFIRSQIFSIAVTRSTSLLFHLILAAVVQTPLCSKAFPSSNETPPGKSQTTQPLETNIFPRD